MSTGKLARRWAAALAASVAIAASGAAWSGCGDDDVDQAVEDVQRETEKAVDKAKEKGEKAVEDAKEEAEKALDGKEEGKKGEKETGDGGN